MLSKETAKYATKKYYILIKK